MTFTTAFRAGLYFNAPELQRRTRRRANLRRTRCAGTVTGGDHWRLSAGRCSWPGAEVVITASDSLTPCTSLLSLCDDKADFHRVLGANGPG